jgi:hypothetical protein
LTIFPHELHLSSKGGTDIVTLPDPGVGYDFWVTVVNRGSVPSGPFIVRFKLKPGSWEKDFKQDKGLKPGGSIKAVVGYKFENKDEEYYSEAYLASDSDRDTPLESGVGPNKHIVKKKTYPSGGDKSQAAQDQDVGAPACDGGDAFSPDAFYAQTLQSSGYTVGSDPCLDKCWDEFYRCLKNGRDSGMQCLARLEACKRRCATAGGDDSEAADAVPSTNLRRVPGG